MPKITAKIHTIRPSRGKKSAYLRIEASGGMTYCRVSNPFRGKLKHIYSTWRTESRDPDVAIEFIRMPLAVRRLMRANPAVIEQPETV